ncbi:MAG TPA: TetR family transcriptional regulator C-terminal domain-containing protein [Gemmatimonadales bacterium]|nr:TetR family transcriptional regulator C-terminal domain-containing protein [Gemmatimonadales bacterium]
MPGQKATEATRREEILRAAHEVALRRGIDGLTVRAVAARARLSHSLVLFHFKRKDQLGLALLDRVLATTVSPGNPDAIGAVPDPRERLLALFRREMQRLSAEPRGVRLLLEYWARGAHNATIRKKILAALAGYRAVFRSPAEEAMGPQAGRSGSMTPAGVAAAAVSLILGYSVQAMIDPGQLDGGEYLASVEGFLGRPPSAA